MPIGVLSSYGIYRIFPDISLYYIHAGCAHACGRTLIVTIHKMLFKK